MKNQLKIHGMAFEGRGVARREDGKVVFVDGALPGDVVEDTPTVVKKKFDAIKDPTWISKSSLHVKSPCKISYECGGCGWQHAEASAQNEWKHGFLKDALERIGKISEVPEIEFHPASKRYDYRPRLTIQGEPVDGILKWGFFKRATHTVIEADGCPVATGPISQLLVDLNSFKIKSNERVKLHAQEVMTGTNQVKKLNITLLPPSPAKILKELEKNLDKEKIHWLGKKRDASKAPLAVWWQDDITYLTSPFQFQQSHHEQNNNLKKLLLEEVVNLKPEKITDLFCGSGNLSLPLLKKGYPVHGVEVDETAIRVAGENLKINDLSGSYIKKSATHKKALAGKSSPNHLVIVDPPRSGLEDGVEALISEAPDHIFYVSCHPMTLAKDLSKLVHAGYALKRIIGMDFFPGTFHVEAFVVLKNIRQRASYEK